MDVRRFAAAGLLAALLLAPAGCGGTGTDGPGRGAGARPAGAPLVPAAGSANASPAPSPSAATPATPSVRPSLPRRTTGAPLRVPACTTGQLLATVIRQPAASTAGSQAALLTLANTSSRDCALSGWASVQLTDANNRPVQVPTVAVRKPRTPAAILVPAGRSAFAGLSWQTCAQSEVGCAAGSGFRVTPPDSATGTESRLVGPAPGGTDIRMRSLRIGTIQRTTVGVVGW
jgi:hypothetical protein